jgi:hypothetical protein
VVGEWSETGLIFNEEMKELRIKNEELRIKKESMVEGKVVHSGR